MVRAIIGMLIILGSLSLAHAAGGPAAITQYQTPAGQLWAPYSSDLPKCDDAGVRSTISGRFDQTENTFWGGEHAIGGFERVREIGFRANGLSYLPRRYCVARAMIDDPRTTPPEQRKPRTVVYSVGAAEGIIGVTWGVEWCVAGLDREHAYAPDCLVLRPIIERWLGERPWHGEYGLKARY
jgi:hypothetical protein